MEIEAKFAVPDIATFQQLQAVEHIAGFSLSAHQVQQVRDTYLDTDERLILANGYACRCRETESEVLITLKGLGRADGAIHRRAELEISMPSYEPLQDWPESPVRDLVEQMTGGDPLKPLFELRQTRVFRRMSQGELLVAQLSLDNVRVVAGKRRKSHFELEVELAPQGTTSDMGAIVIFLQDEWNLVPEPRSKFERALIFLDEDGDGEAILTPQERALLVQIAKRNDLYGRRARGLLLLDTGLPHDEVAQEADRTTRTIRRWLSVFGEKRLASFPDNILWEVQSTPAAILPDVPSLEPDEDGQGGVSTRRPEPQPLKALFKRYAVDQAHARSVADHALTLFDRLGAWYTLPTKRRPLLEIAAMVHSIGLASYPDGRHKTGRDILLAHPPEELDEEERLMVALTTYLQRERVTSKKLHGKMSQDPFDYLPKKARREALALAALMRVADGLDYSQTQSTELIEVTQKGDGVDIEVTGPYAAIDAARAQEKSDLWRLLFDTDLRFRPTHLTGDFVPYSGQGQAPGVAIDLMPEELPEHPDVSADDGMPEAARKLIAFHFQRMLYHEPGTRVGEDIEELHDMRVATRRIRAALRVFGKYLDAGELKSFRKGVERTGRRLGNVRDLDVFWDKTQRYLDGLPPERKNDLMPLREAWEMERERAREKLLTYLDSKRYLKLKERSVELLERGDVWQVPALTKKGAARPYRVRHVVPAAVYERVAAVLAYGEWIDGADVPLKRLHRLRIAGKRLRYTLEFFEEVLAPQTGDLIKQMKRLQDHLGDLQDAVVASELLRDFLTWGTWGHSEGKKGAKKPMEPVVAPGVAVYMADKQAELQRLLSTFPEVWAYFQSPAFKQAVAVAVAPL
jgi:CHAD domain-containing protein